MIEIKADYQFDDPDLTLPVWRVKYQRRSDREARMPFFKCTSFVRAESRQGAIDKVLAYFPSYDRFSASKAK
jgi:hypothetical protein